MALSIQRTALIIVVVKLILLAMVIGISSGNSPDPEGTLGTFQAQTSQSQRTILDYFFDGSTDTSNVYIEKQIGDEKLAFEMSVWDALSVGLVGWIPADWVGDNQAERDIFFFFSLLLTAISFIAYYEIFQIIRGKTT